MKNRIKRLITFGGYFDLDNKEKVIFELSKQLEDKDFWNDRKQAERVIDKLNKEKKLVNELSKLKKQIQEKKEILEFLWESPDKELEEILIIETEALVSSISKFEILSLLGGPYDKNNCILEIHSGAGGTEACDWALMLYRMYTRWCEKKGYKYEVIDYQDGEETGIKSSSILIKGEYVFGYLKCEKGVHRLIRLSPFDSNNKRHTSFASVDITPEFEDDINIEVKEEDLKIDVYRSSGAGGQSVNTTDSAVRITHLPTGIVVTCQNERSQLQNKERALKTLKNKLYLIEMEKQQEKIKEIKGNKKEINFGSQIRSYVMHPYSMVKDHRTNHETSDVNKVLDGGLDGFLESYLKR